MMTQSLRVSVLQMDVSLGETELNFVRAAEMLEKAVESAERPDVIILPEMWNTGYALDRIGQLADIDGERTKQMMSRFCRTHRVNVIAGSISEKKVDKIYNTAYVFNRQ